MNFGCFSTAGSAVRFPRLPRREIVFRRARLSFSDRAWRWLHVGWSRPSLGRQFTREDCNCADAAPLSRSLRSLRFPVLERLMKFGELRKERRTVGIDRPHGLAYIDAPMSFSDWHLGRRWALRAGEASGS